MQAIETAVQRPDAPIVPATARGEATRRRLLAAAEEEFGHKGFHAASVSSITLRAGVGQGTFYLYFRSKEEIFTTLVQDIGSTLRRQMRDAAAACRNSAEAGRGRLESFLGFAQTHPGLFRIVQESQFVDEAAFREYYERLAQDFCAGLPGATDERAWAVMGIGHFLGMRHCLWQEQKPDPATLTLIMDLIGSGSAAGYASD
ncbi:MAG: TetR/AcrR family transcriptional regulator [Stenotrophobium sp.]